MESLEPLIRESAQLMLIGMSTVFIILIMLIILISMVSRLLSEPEPEPCHGSQENASPSMSRAVQDNELIAVITAAVTRFRNNNNN